MKNYSFILIALVTLLSMTSCSSSGPPGTTETEPPATAADTTEVTETKMARQPVWLWSGEYYGYIANDSLYNQNGDWVGQVSEQNIFDANGSYIGEVRENKRLLKSDSKSELVGPLTGNTMSSVTLPQRPDKPAMVLPPSCSDFN